MRQAAPLLTDHSAGRDDRRRKARRHRHPPIVPSAAYLWLLFLVLFTILEPDTSFHRPDLPARLQRRRRDGHARAGLPRPAGGEHLRPHDRRQSGALPRADELPRPAFSRRPNVWGTIIAYFALAFGIKGLQLVSGTNSYWVQPLFEGGALVLAVALAARPTIKRIRRERAGFRFDEGRSRPRRVRKP